MANRISLRCRGSLGLLFLLAGVTGSASLHAQVSPTVSAPGPTAPASAPSPAVPAPVPSSATLPVVDKLRISVDPVTSVGYKETSGTLKLQLTNSDTERKFRVELGRPFLKAGDTAGSAEFPEHGNADAAELTVGKDKTVTLAINVKGMTRLGTYDGVVRVRPLEGPAAETRQPFQIIRPSPGFDPTFRGQDVANGVLTLKPKAQDDNSFPLTVESPAAAAEANITVSVAANFGGSSNPPKLRVKGDSTITLSPGSSETLVLEIADLPPSGEYLARLKFTEARTGATKQLDVRLQPAFVGKFQWLLIAGLVALGAVLSALVGVALPGVSARKRLTGRLAKARETLAAVPASEQLSREALLRLTQRVEELVREVWWFQPSAPERIAACETKVGELERRVELLIEVGAQRAVLLKPGDVPSSLLEPLSRELDEVGMAAVKETLDAAKEQFTKAKQNLAAAVSTSDLLGFINAAMATFPTDETLNADGTPEADLNMRLRLSRLRKTHATLGATPLRDDLLAVERECQCARLYFIRYLGRVLAKHPGDDFKEAGADVLDALNRGELLEAEALLDSLERGVTKKKLEEALKDLSKSARVVVSPPNPRGGELVAFTITFADSALNTTPLLQAAPFLWSFGDGMPVSHGVTVGHHYRRSRRRDEEFKYEVAVGLGEKQRLSDNLTIRRASWSTLFAGYLEMVSFGVVLAGAIVLALLANYADARPLETWRDWFNPALWGFGADRLKSIVNTRFGS